MESIYNKGSLTVIRLSITKNQDEYGVVGACLVAVSDESGVSFSSIFGRTKHMLAIDARRMLVGMLHENGVSVKTIAELLGRKEGIIYDYIVRHKELVEIYGK
jgi:hypothetical protein